MGAYLESIFEANNREPTPRTPCGEKESALPRSGGRAILGKQGDTGKTGPLKADLKIACGAVRPASTVDDRTGKWLTFQPFRTGK